ALLDLAKVLIDEGDDEKAQKYLETIKENIDRYIIGVLWDEEFGAFKFSEIDYYTPDIIRFVGWNAFIFEFLTRKVENDFSYKPNKFKLNFLATKNYYYVEGKRFVFILGIKPLRSLILYFAIKRVNIALIYVSANQLEKLLVRVLPTWVKNMIKKVVEVCKK
ncbi:unnamed protein product, partial [marine sediment metagenome]